MTKMETDPYPGHGGRYIYQKTGSTPDRKQEADLSTDRGKSTETHGLDLEKSLLRSFPEIACGNAFIEYVSKKLESWDHFDAVVICPDPVMSSASDNSLTFQEVMPLLAEIVDTTCRIYSGFWGLWHTDCLACFFEVKENYDIFNIIETIRKELRFKTDATFSVGIAGYPQLAFQKDHILENAHKALHHAGLLGQNSTVRFDAVSLNISGDKLYQDGNVDSAMIEFKTALLMDPQNVNVSNSLGVCYSSKGEHLKALEQFKKVMALSPEDVIAPYNAGLAYLMTGDKQNALEMFLTAHTLDKNQFEVVIQLGRLYLELKDLESGRKYLEKAVEMDAESGPAHRFLGECYNELNMVNEGIQAYSKAVKINANDAYSLSALACMYARQKINQEIAIVFARQSVDLSPSTALFHERLGEVYYLLGHFEDALKEFKVASDLGQDCRTFIQEIEHRLMADAS